jgi:hypothetical protein
MTVSCINYGYLVSLTFRGTDAQFFYLVCQFSSRELSSHVNDENFFLTFSIFEIAFNSCVFICLL